jgi:hypothetical protein
LTQALKQGIELDNATMCREGELVREFDSRPQRVTHECLSARLGQFHHFRVLGIYKLLELCARFERRVQLTTLNGVCPRVNKGDSFTRMTQRCNR